MKSTSLARLRHDLQVAALASAEVGRHVAAFARGETPAAAPDAAARLAWWLLVGGPALDPTWIAIGPMVVGELERGTRSVGAAIDAIEGLGGEAVEGLDEVEAQAGEALRSTVAAQVGGVTGRHLAAWFAAARSKARAAARAGQWDQVPLEGPDAAAARMALRFLPVDDALAVLELWWEAEDKSANEDWEGAAASLAAAGARAPNLFETWVRRARVQAARQDRFGAAADVERALSLNPRSALGRAMRAELRMLIRDVVGSLEDWDAAIAAAPEHAPFYLRRAYTKMAAGKAGEAAADADRAVALSPDDASTRFARADLAVRARAFDRAIADYDAILERDARDAQALLNRATARLMMRDPSAARADLDRLVEDRPTEAVGWLRRGMAGLQLGEPFAAWVDALTALALLDADNPSHEQAAEVLRRAYHALSPDQPADPAALRARWVLARRVGLPLARMGELLGEHLPAEGFAWHALRAEALTSGRKLAEAEAAWRDALVVEDQPAGWLQLARVQREAGRPADAQASLERVDAGARDERWTLERDLAGAQRAALEGRLADAVVAFDALAAAHPERAELWFSLAVHRSLTGDGAGAIAAYTEAVTRQPGMAVAWYNRGCERARAGDDAGAVADVTRGVVLDEALADEARKDTWLEGLRGRGLLDELLGV